MKKICMILFGVCLSVGAMAQGTLAFDVNAGVKSRMTVYDGTEVSYTAYERLFYVTNVEDSTYQFLNVYVPDGATQQTPIFLRTYVGGYMASPAAQPQAGDATGRALKEGYVVVIPGTRGRNSSIVADKAYIKAHKGVKKGQTVYTGRAPKAILDLKAAIRYLRHFDRQMPGDAERIITDGTSAGGAMSALMGATGNNPEYAELLKAMGAADERDDVFASVCYCPIIDLDMQKYLNYVVSTQALKGVPAFDSQIEGINNASGENEEFGDETGSCVNFTDYTAQKNGKVLTDEIRRNVRLMNPMSFIGDGKTSVAPHWYIRHGARDRDTAFPIPVNFATKLQNAGKDVNFLLAWNRPHSGDYALDELFQWIAEITK